jgi:hypothetical protein
MSITRTVVTLLAAGVVAAGSTTLTASDAGTSGAVLTAFSTSSTSPTWGHDHHTDWHSDNRSGSHSDSRTNRRSDNHTNWHWHGYWDGDRRHDGSWDGHPWRWWNTWGISADLCRDGGGHVDWGKHRCDGGRFDDFHVR